MGSRKIKRVGDTVEGSKQRGEVDGVGELRLCPARLYGRCDVRASDGLRVGIDLQSKAQQRLLFLCETSEVESSCLERADDFSRATLSEKKITVTVGAVRAVILGRNERRDHLLVLSGEAAIDEKDSGCQIDHALQHEGIRGEAFHNAGNVGPSETRSEFPVQGQNVLPRCVLFNDSQVSGGSH